MHWVSASWAWVHFFSLWSCLCFISLKPSILLHVTYDFKNSPSVAICSPSNHPVVLLFSPLPPGIHEVSVACRTPDCPLTGYKGKAELSSLPSRNLLTGKWGRLKTNEIMWEHCSRITVWGTWLYSCMEVLCDCPNSFQKCDFPIMLFFES